MKFNQIYYQDIHTVLETTFKMASSIWYIREIRMPNNKN